MADNPFVQYLCRLAEREERGALAALRRGAGKEPGATPEAFPIVVPWLPKDARRRQEDAYFLLASLFGAHPCHADSLGSMGDTLRRAAGDEIAGAERRFVALLNAHYDDLQGHLRHAVSLAASHDTPVNYDKLLIHLNHWDHPDRWVQRQWARDFWGAARSVEESTTATQEEGE